MKKRYTVLLIISLISFEIKAGTFTSNVASGAWDNPASWVIIGDSDGIPDENDDVTILNGHNITWTLNSKVRNVTVDNGGTLTNAQGTSVMIVFGDYLINGTEAGSGFYSFTGTGTIVGGTGTFSNQNRWMFQNNRTIQATVTTTKTAWTRISNGAVVTNLGNITLASLINAGGPSKWINGMNAITTFTNTNVTVILDASSFPNTIVYKITGSSPEDLPSVMNETYYNITIASSSKYAHLLNNTTVLNNFTMLSGGKFKLETGMQLSIGGNFTYPGGGTTIFNMLTGSTLNFNGSGAQSIAANSATLSIENIIVNKSGGTATVNSGIFNIQNSLTVASGSLNLGSNRFNLISNSSKTAYIGQSSGTVSGTMTIQRYVNARSDGYSDMSSPVTSATFAGWTDDMYLVFSPYIPNVSEPSAYGYDESAWDYYGIETSSTPITPGVGYEVYLANDGDTLSSFVATTLDLTGTPNMGDVTVDCTVDNDGWNLVGNPYASHISFANFISTAGIAINGTYQYFDETIEDFASSSGTIAPGEGFWIECTTAGTASFKESNKVASTSSSYRVNQQDLFSLRVKSDKIKFTSNTYFRFDDNASLAYESDHDLSFLRLPDPKAPSMYTSSLEGKKLRINELKAENELTLPVHFKAGIIGEYTIMALNTESAYMEGYDAIILEDKALNIFYDISSSDYTFHSEINEETERFVIHLKKSAVELIESKNYVSFLNSVEGVFVNFNLDQMEGAYISVFNMAGQEISETVLVAAEDNRFRISIPEHFKGPYIIRVVLDNKVITQQYFKY